MKIKLRCVENCVYSRNGRCRGVGDNGIRAWDGTCDFVGYYKKLSVVKVKHMDITEFVMKEDIELCV